MSLGLVIPEPDSQSPRPPLRVQSMQFSLAIGQALGLIIPPAGVLVVGVVFVFSMGEAFALTVKMIKDGTI